MVILVNAPPENAFIRDKADLSANNIETASFCLKYYLTIFQIS